MTFDTLFRYGIHVPMQGLALLTALAYVFGVRVRPWWAWMVTAAGIAVFVVGLGLNYPPLGTDIHYRWLEGTDIARGASPYGRPPCVYPPNAFPLFVVFSCFGYPQLLLVWTAGNALGFLLLIPAAAWALSFCADADAWRLPAPALGVLSAALALSVAARLALDVGQLVVPVTLMLLAALAAQQCRRPALAGVGLALAAIKAATLLPFLLLFLRRRDRAAWLSMAGLSMVLCLLATAPTDLPGRVRECLDNIHALNQPGGMNNFAGHTNVDLIGLDRAAYYAGLASREGARAFQWLALVVLGAWLAWQVRRREALPPAAAWSLVALYSMLFLYHRLYDACVLVIPLLYAAGQARQATGPRRWLYGGGAAAVLGVWYFRYETVQALCYGPAAQGWLGQVLAAVVIPHAIWLTLAGLLCLAAAEMQGRPATVAAVEPLPQAA